MKTWIRGVLILLVVGVGIWRLWPRSQIQARTRIEGLAMPTASSFARADGPRSFTFPQDFGPHPAFQTEWWYYTGNLATKNERRFGYELTFFRRALVSPGDTSVRASNWAANQVYLAHFTLSDIQGGAFHYLERSDRGAVDLAGARSEPAFQVWLGSWFVDQTGPQTFHIKADQADIRLELDLRDLKGPVLQGVNGYSQKGAAGNASYYFSQTRLDSRGIIRIDGLDIPVEGSSWMDHEFSTSALAADQVGWDWFGLQLDDGGEVMLYTLRKTDGSADPFSQGTWIAADGSPRRLGRDDFQVSSRASWKSPHTGAIYPAEWRVIIPAEQLDLTVKPRLADQELRVSYTYWEGAVRVEGTRNGNPVSGTGYVELTGYAESMQGHGP